MFENVNAQARLKCFTFNFHNSITLKLRNTFFVTYTSICRGSYPFFSWINQYVISACQLQ